MKKSFKRGFIMAETIIVAIVVLTALIILYTQFISINNSYYRSFRYNTVDDLYAVNNIRNFIINDNYENIISSLEDKNYVDLTDCSTTYFKEYNYCKTLLNTLNVKTLILAYEDLAKLKDELKENNTLSEGLHTFIKTIPNDKNNKYRLIVEFNDDRYATLKLGSFIVSDISNECAKSNNTCTIDDIKTGVSLKVAVNDSETYDFYVLKDDGINLTLIMNDNFENNIWSDETNSDGPFNLIEYMDAKTKNWENVHDITYTLNGNNYNNYTGCTDFNVCEENIYTLSTKNSKIRLPLLQELTNLGCTKTAGSCPVWLSNNLNSSNKMGYWTSTANSTNEAWILSYDNKIDSVSVNNQNIGVRPVIVIDKSIIK